MCFTGGLNGSVLFAAAGLKGTRGIIFPAAGTGGVGMYCTTAKIRRDDLTFYYLQKHECKQGPLERQSHCHDLSPFITIIASDATADNTSSCKLLY